MVIKFRAKEIKGEWVYGNFIHDKRFKGMSNEFRIHDQDTGMESDVLGDSVMMYLGQNDKNGVEIYKGDIVTRQEFGCDGVPSSGLYEVGYDDLNYRFCLIAISSKIFIKGAVALIGECEDLEIVK